MAQMKIGRSRSCEPQRSEYPTREFTSELQERFLTLFAGTSDIRACAEEIGVARSTIYGRRRTDPVFREAFALAQEQAVVTLRAELVSRALALVQASTPDDRAAAALQGMDAKMILSLIAQHERALGREAGDSKPQKSDASEAAARLQALLIRMRLERKRELAKKRQQRGG